MKLSSTETAPKHDRLLVWANPDLTCDGVLEGDGEERWGEPAYYLIDRSEMREGERVFFSTAMDPSESGFELIVRPLLFFELPEIS